MKLYIALTDTKQWSCSDKDMKFHNMWVNHAQTLWESGTDPEVKKSIEIMYHSSSPLSRSKSAICYTQYENFMESYVCKCDYNSFSAVP